VGIADGEDKDERKLGLPGSGMGVAIVWARRRKKVVRTVARYILLGEICSRSCG
jgi:hypothetical protein